MSVAVRRSKGLTTPAIEAWTQRMDASSARCDNVDASCDARTASSAGQDMEQAGGNMDTTASWGAFLLATAATLIGYRLGMTWWELLIVFLCVGLGVVMVKAGE